MLVGRQAIQTLLQRRMCRTPRQIYLQWTATTKAVLPVLKGTPRPVQELRQLLSWSRLNGANPSLCREEDGDGAAYGLSRTMPLHSLVACGSQLDSAAAGDDVHIQVNRDAGARKNGHKHRKLRQEASENVATRVVQEEWLRPYRADMMRHAAQLYAAMGALPDS